jgi:hypothetical protein
MNEAAAAQVLLLRAYESTGFAPWSDADRAWAGRAALQTVGADAAADEFLAARAQLGLQRLAPHDPRLARWRTLRPWRVEALLAVVVLGFVLGVLVDRIGSVQRINLLAPPVWGVIAWNLAVYVWLLGQSAFGAAGPGALRQGLAAALRRWRTRGQSRGDGASAAVWKGFAADWTTLSLPLNGARIAMALHLGAAALALGLIAGMYLRGLVLDYRAGWESTFLEAGTVSAVLSALLAPASVVSGIAVPDPAAMQALRVAPGVAGEASAAPWIHLYAWQLLLLVVLPRLLLALWAGLRARRLAGDFALPLHEPYFQRLSTLQRGEQRRVLLWPHAQTPDAAAQAALGRLFARVFGDGVVLRFAPPVAYGGEDEVAPQAADGTVQVALFDLAATPEPDSQGRLLQALAAGAPPLALIDEGAFVARFGADAARLPARREAWSALAASAGASAVFVNLREADLSDAEAALQTASASPSATS